MSGVQQRFRSDPILSNERRKEFQAIIEQTLRNFRAEGVSEVEIERLLLRKEKLERLHTKLRRRPEDVTKELVIEPILAFLGYSQLGRSSGSADSSDQKEVDYTLEVDNERILVEAEPLNKELFGIKNQGAEQLKSYLEKKSFRSDLGIATNGFDWVLLKYDTKTYSFRQVRLLDLRPFFQFVIGQEKLVDTTEKDLGLFCFTFAQESILAASDDFNRLFEAQKEQVTKRFYQDYIHYVFGYDKATKRGNARCLLTALEVPAEITEKDRRLFVIALMSRLIFVKFLEDRKLVNPNFFRNLLRDYRDKSIPSSFYRTYLQPLFYDVLNTPIGRRKSEVVDKQQFNSIPYLNGGLFREVVPNELQYDVHNDIIELIIETLEKYAFTLEDRSQDTLNPDILGLVFEKTINYLTGEGNDRRKDLGAYYTPDDVTTYIGTQTIRARIFEIIIANLRRAGWKESDIDPYRSLEDFLDNPPTNPKTMKEVYDSISKVTILDPACGSGHFLASAMKELVRIRKAILLSLNKRVNNYQIKKEIITSNLFGVDIESSAVEIARLRLWLSLIEDLDASDREKIETLPNIEYNIFEGNSLLGFTEPPQNEQMGMDDDTSTQELFREIDDLKREFRSTSDSRKASELRNAIDARMKEQDAELNKKLVAQLASYGKGGARYSLEQLSAKIPFHWRLKFGDIFLTNRGFDIVIGNPPWVESVTEDSSLFSSFATRKCGNIYAYFIERSMKLVSSSGGYLGFIVPVASISTPRMSELQRLLLDSSSELRISNYDDRPGKIFPDLEHCRASIIIAKKRGDASQSPKNSDKCEVFSTTYNRWRTEERDKLFGQLVYTQVTDVLTPSSIPKVGLEIEKRILAKIKTNTELEKILLQADQASASIWYHNAPQYWIRALDFTPYFHSSRDNVSISSHLKELRLPSKYSRAVVGILNSSLFYWYFVVYSNGRDLTSREVTSFPISLERMGNSLLDSINTATEALMKDYKKYKVRKKTTYQKTGEVVYDEFYPGKSKKAIDKIDDLLAAHLGLSNAELDFIKNYSIEFRLGEEEREIVAIPLAA